MIVKEIFILVLLNFHSNRINARAVNISNTWTLPEEGYGVFYRFFRDQISWYEADAVCQFHHANLITVDNGVQFDAARAFLKELDVNGNVWIGLRKPENTNKFSWTNNKALEKINGYWAEMLPAVDSPLCAVIDPARDFRWHALQCGGPETASFLCELHVPDWATDCTIKAMPSLTVQFMSDTGSVQLSRDCGELGSRHISCRGRQDYEMILEQLQCNDDENISLSPLPEVKDLQKIAASNKTNKVANGKKENTKNLIKKLNQIEEKKGYQNVQIGKNNLNEERISAKKMPSKFEKPNKFNKKPLKKTSKYDKSSFNKMENPQPKVEKNDGIDKQILNTSESAVIEIVSMELTKMNTLPTPNDLSTTQETLTMINYRDKRYTETDSTITYTTEHEHTDSMEISNTTPFKSVEKENINKASKIPSTTPIESLATDSTLSPETTRLSSNRMDTGNDDDHFIPPMLLVKAKFQSTHPHMEYSTRIIDITPKITEEFTSSSQDFRSSTTAFSEITTNSYSSSKETHELNSQTTEKSDYNRNDNTYENNITNNNSSNVNGDVTVQTTEVISSNRIDNNLSLMDNYKPYKRNRRRLYTKSDKTSYLKRILG